MIQHVKRVGTTIDTTIVGGGAGGGGGGGYAIRRRASHKDRARVIRINITINQLRILHLHVELEVRERRENALRKRSSSCCPRYDSISSNFQLRPCSWCWCSCWCSWCCSCYGDCDKDIQRIHHHGRGGMLGQCRTAPLAGALPSSRARGAERLGGGGGDGAAAGLRRGRGGRARLRARLLGSRHNYTSATKLFATLFGDCAMHRIHNIITSIDPSMVRTHARTTHGKISKIILNTSLRINFLTSALSISADKTSTISAKKHAILYIMMHDITF